MSGNENRVGLRYFFFTREFTYAWNAPFARPLKSGKSRNIRKQPLVEDTTLVPWGTGRYGGEDPSTGSMSSLIEVTCEGENTDAKYNRDRLVQEQCKGPAGESWSQMVTF